MENSEKDTVENETVNSAEEKAEPENKAEEIMPDPDTTTSAAEEIKQDTSVNESAEEKNTEPDAKPSEEKTAEKADKEPETEKSVNEEEKTAAEGSETDGTENKAVTDSAETKIFRAIPDKKTEEIHHKEIYDDNSEENAHKKRKKKSSVSPIRIIILVICIGVFAFSAYKIVMEIIDGINTDKMSDNIWETVRSGDETYNAEHDDINVPPAPIDPNVSGSGTSNTPETQSQDNTDNSQEQNIQGEDNTQSEDNAQTAEPENTPENTPENVTPPSSESEQTPAEPEDTQEYNDRTYEEELQEQQQTPEEVDTQYYISRPKKDKDAAEIGVVIRPEEIAMSSVPYLRVSNLKSLLRINDDTVGWIFVPGSREEAKGTPIDTAIVQTTDNDFYLNHTFDKKENENGWVYADYRCNLDSITSNYNTVIYGHARSYTMFGGLKNLNEAVEWYQNGNNHFIKINTYKDETVWQIFSWYETDIYYDYIKTDFADSNDFIRFAYDVQRKNQMEGVFETFEFSENDRILTLSTCKGFDRAVRVAVHAKLVKRNDLTQ
ncbi:MAG: sortase [Clostridia bacterium]|nr:sortase [Clostridia bacterium]